MNEGRPGGRSGQLPVLTKRGHYWAPKGGQSCVPIDRLKDWRRVATRYDRCPKVFLSAIALAATVIYWL
ncbi:hypothetical protein BDD41_3495 [Paracoccus versutus]|uniref:Transposase n=1 Tax=Paracoccus versutus TaxID=34007 RepID=A0A3D9XNI6_PARVE|nr:hypothetical protein BDD41_3495 [Paracoccus versutus]